VVIRHKSFEIDRKNRTIKVGDRVRHFTRIGAHSCTPENDGYFFKAVCYLILNRWTSRQELFDYIFALDENGGPDSGLKSLDVQLHYWQPKLIAAGMHIVREKRAGLFWYKIQEIPVDG